MAVPSQREAVRANISSSCIHSAASVLPPAGSSRPIATRPSVHQQSLPLWLEQLSPTQNPFASDLASYWQAAYWNSANGLPGPFASPSKEDPVARVSTCKNCADKTPASGAISFQPRESSSAVDTSPFCPKFDGNDRLSLNDGWFLIRGDDAFFLELAGTGLDIPIGSISTLP